ncbi:hypothetical protein C5Y96_05845 [Blastopirellula marina]|uniref:Uncharacterized protein n=1 Tax=Blastopirellula marina TaxID=124 RepID=A0A2S8G4J7_9BACT|nr:MULTISPECIES: hypothetical protein [Pirellulaceae]PQO39376.1 hypothetical protein C5Y96_05845 [Blastopirellula marina]RCS55684.1 hypothetical protein DTL36_05855 [Bremerella cremea]
MNASYQEVPVQAAKEIGLHFSKNAVVIIAVDAMHDKLHVTSWGNEPSDKVYAARIGDCCHHYLYSQAGIRDLSKEVFEDFRLVPAAKSRKHIEVLTDAAREAIASLEAMNATPVGTVLSGYICNALSKLKQAIEWKPAEGGKS